MKTVGVLIFAFVAISTSGQPSELICLNLPPLPEDPIAERSSLAEVQPLLQRASAITAPQLEGLTIEEAAQVVPEILNSTLITVFKGIQPQVLAGNLSARPNPGDLILVAYQSLLNSTDGVEIFDTMLEDPNNFARLFVLITQNFDQECLDNPNILFLTLLTTMMADLLQEPFRDNFVDIFNTTAVIAITRANLTEAAISVLEPLSENLDVADNVDGALASLLSFVTEDSITVALSSALENSGFIVDPEGVGAILGAFLTRVQKSFEIDGQEFVSFINDIFKSMLAALK
eukprot:TRINITY_DN6711_c0_g1_i13.p2 TRINITY_DN6711_c0_g1~~TRINITY_DN6711_c0_g1_i13.p2  ORF type:complete len:289 (-),score=62.02 TRINITY_DN6711_c0_g1_i13:196-1062(-)